MVAGHSDHVAEVVSWILPNKRMEQSGAMAEADARRLAPAAHAQRSATERMKGQCHIFATAVAVGGC